MGGSLCAKWARFLRQAVCGTVSSPRDACQQPRIVYCRFDPLHTFALLLLLSSTAHFSKASFLASYSVGDQAVSYLPKWSAANTTPAFSPWLCCTVSTKPFLNGASYYVCVWVYGTGSIVTALYSQVVANTLGLNDSAYQYVIDALEADKIREEREKRDAEDRQQVRRIELDMSWLHICFVLLQ